MRSTWDETVEGGYEIDIGAGGWTSIRVVLTAIGLLESRFVAFRRFCFGANAALASWRGGGHEQIVVAAVL